jgi:hypothetical protein
MGLIINQLNKLARYLFPEILVHQKINKTRHFTLVVWQRDGITSKQNKYSAFFEHPVQRTDHPLMTTHFYKNILQHRRKVNCALLGYHAASSIYSFLTFRDNLLVPKLRIQESKFTNPEYGTDSLSRNVGKELPLLSA